MMEFWRRGGDSIPLPSSFGDVCTLLRCYTKQSGYFYFLQLEAPLGTSVGLNRGVNGSKFGSTDALMLNENKRKCQQKRLDFR
jgi:hypothetical protein